MSLGAVAGIIALEVLTAAAGKGTGLGIKALRKRFKSGIEGEATECLEAAVLAFINVLPAMDEKEAAALTAFFTEPAISEMFAPLLRGNLSAVKGDEFLAALGRSKARPKDMDDSFLDEAWDAFEQTYYSELARDKHKRLHRFCMQKLAQTGERRAIRAGSFNPATLTTYLNDVIAETDRIQLRGISSGSRAGRKAASYGIEALYTPLRTVGSARSEQHLVPDRIELKELLSVQQRLLLVGKPGAGKTTFLKLITCVLAKDVRGLEDVNHRPGRSFHLGLSPDREPPVPVFIRLASLSNLMGRDDVDRSSVQWIRRFLEQGHDSATARALIGLLEEKRAALLLDGLDEVGDEGLRARLLDLVAKVVQRWSGNLIVITSRPHGYGEVSDLSTISTAVIDDFQKPEITEFIRRWVRAWDAGEEVPRGVAYRRELEEAIVDSTPIRRMASNPVMLTCLCVVHWNENRLPEGKADLLAAVLRWLLQSKDDKRRKRGYTSAFAEECYKALARAMTAHSDGKQVIVGLGWAADRLGEPFEDEKDITGGARLRRAGISFLENEMLDSGIVESAGVGQLKFWHLIFQEHYAARSLVELGDGAGEEGWWYWLEPNLCDPQWSEVLEHFAGCLIRTGRKPTHKLIRRMLGTIQADDLASVARATGATGRVLRILDAYDYKLPSRLGWAGIRDQALEIFTREGAARVPVKERIVAAEALGEGGDPRLTGTLRNQLEVPGLSGLTLGKYPVTVEEFRRFVEDGGYSDRCWWGEHWKTCREEGWVSPGFWETQLHTRNRPVAEVSWYEAVAYCRWLSELTERKVRLPTTKEWYAAARHLEGGYPWGALEPNPELANFAPHWKPYVGHPTPVGVYPDGAAPGGHLDLAGNVWEWCEDRLGDEARAPRPLRGGSWWDSAKFLRSTFRYRKHADVRDGPVGFRVLVASCVR